MSQAVRSGPQWLETFAYPTRVHGGAFGTRFATRAGTLESLGRRLRHLRGDAVCFLLEYVRRGTDLQLPLERVRNAGVQALPEKNPVAKRVLYVKSAAHAVALRRVCATWRGSMCRRGRRLLRLLNWQAHYGGSNALVA